MLYYDEDISIHAPAKGATMIERLMIGRTIFQSTLPRRERPIKTIDKMQAIQISIHAPAKGATRAAGK